MSTASLNDEQYGLLFDVRRSIRYHDRRRAFFQQFHGVTSVLTILLSGSVLFELASGSGPAGWLMAISIAAALLAATDMVVGYAACANRHEGLRGRFIGLESAMLETAAADAPAWQKHRLARLKIEHDEPPVYRALDMLCYAELEQAEGAQCPGGFRVGLIQRITSQFLHWPNITAA